MKKLCLILIALSLAAFQQPEGTAKSCNNDSKVESHNCHCAMTACPKPGEDAAVPDSKCKTYCKPKLCFCCPDCKPSTIRK